MGGGTKGMLAPLLKLLGGAAPSPPPTHTHTHTLPTPMLVFSFFIFDCKPLIKAKELR